MLTAPSISLFQSFFSFILSPNHCIYSWRYANELAASVWWINQSLFSLMNEVQHEIVGKKKHRLCQLTLGFKDLIYSMECYSEHFQVSILQHL